MKVFPNNIEEHLGFNEIRNILESFSQSEKGRERVRKLRPSNEIRFIQRWLAQTKEMIQLKAEERDNLLFDFPDIEEFLIKVQVPGSFLDPQDFHELKIGVTTLISWTTFFESSDEFQELGSLSNQIEIEPTLPLSIDRVIDERGEVKDSASPTLVEIRTNISKSERAVRSAIQKVLKKAKSDHLTDEESAFTIREGRLVIPVKAEFKKRIPGFIHDESATGQTVFIEPGEVLDLNNEVRELKYAERREVIRILIELSDQVRANMSGLKKGVDLLEKLDFIHAKSLLAEHLEARIPTFSKRTAIKWDQAIHPLLSLAHKASGGQVIPLNIQLDMTDRILIISGPNAGGKSVALKTVGLLQYMFQCGLPVPVDESSEFGIFGSLFLDIGDTQSIEDDLSTYSSHLTSMNHFLKHADKRTLFLIDEFGKGTEPQFGGAIAESVLEELNQKRSFGIITTHYQNLKNYGDTTEGVVNGAMKYDLENLEPLFQLEIGKPGSSFAFEIAQKIGLPKPLINVAKKKIGASHVDYDASLTKLEKERSKFEKLNKKLDGDKKELIQVRQDYEDLRGMLEDERKRIIKQAKQEAKGIVDEANKDVERVIREIQESKAAKQKTKELREELQDRKRSYIEKEKEAKIAFKIGDSVKMLDQDTVGIIQKVKGKQVEVLFGNLKSIVSIDKLERTGSNPIEQHQRKVKKLGIDLSNKMAGFTHELSIRGMRAEEAIGKVESFIDEALLLGVDEVKIVHGKGHGVLREIVRNYTKDHPSIASVADEHADRGGDGISIIKLR